MNDKHNKEIRCSNCGKILAEGHICDGKITIDCRCGTENTIEAKQKEVKHIDPRENYIRKDRVA